MNEIKKTTFLAFKDKKGNIVSVVQKEETEENGSSLGIMIDISGAEAEKTTEQTFDKEVKKIKDKQ